MQAYKRAWEERNVELMLTLFTPDVDYRINRFGLPLSGLHSVEDYWRNQVAEYQRDVRFQFEIWAVKAMQGYVGFQAQFIWLPMNGIVELDCACRMRFSRGADNALFCAKFEEWRCRRST